MTNFESFEDESQIHYKFTDGYLMRCKKCMTLIVIYLKYKSKVMIVLFQRISDSSSYTSSIAIALFL